MAYDDLRAWIKALDKAGELKRIHEPVDPILEIAEITDRVSKRGGPKGGPALLFENVKGYPGSQVLMNQFGSERRMKLALDVKAWMMWPDVSRLCSSSRARKVCWES